MLTVATQYLQEEIVRMFSKLIRSILLLGPQKLVRTLTTKRLYLFYNTYVPEPYFAPKFKTIKL